MSEAMSGRGLGHTQEGGAAWGRVKGELGEVREMGARGACVSTPVAGARSCPRPAAATWTARGGWEGRRWRGTR